MKKLSKKISTKHTSRLCTFYIVRHGESEWNVERKLAGQVDSLLTEKGEMQAKKVAEELRHISFDLAFSSDLIRAKRTAEIIALEHNLVVTTTKLLRERSFGKWEGESYEIFTNELKGYLDEFLSLPDEKKKTYKYPDMESDEEIVSRIITFLRETAVAYPGKTVLVGTHGAMMRSLLIHLGFGTYDEIPPGGVTNTAYMKVASDGIDFFLQDTQGVRKITEEK